MALSAGQLDSWLVHAVSGFDEEVTRTGVSSCQVSVDRQPTPHRAIPQLVPRNKIRWHQNTSREAMSATVASRSSPRRPAFPRTSASPPTPTRPITADAPGDRTVDPWGLLQVGTTWYLVAAHRGRPRSYRVSRISAVRRLGEPSRRPPDLDLHRVWRQMRDDFRGRPRPRSCCACTGRGYRWCCGPWR
ncbi:helix-turn-helix transcriptional regulator [Nocardia fusca]